MTETTGSEFFVVGGTLGRDAASYVRRQADEQLLTALRGGQFCYVLTSRQMGKSSLMVRAAVALRAQGDTRVAVLDLTALGQNLTPEQWYRGLATRTAQQFSLRKEVDEFWAAHADASPLERWTHALRDVVLERVRERVVIFVDEIDATRSVPFVTDEFFASIRELHNRRAEDPELKRLTFCLIGVATPSDLIQDARTTPFNVGTRIDLADFTEAEAETLLPGLGRADEKIARMLLQRILYWTGGHPYMTQRLCLAVADDQSVDGIAGVDRVCEDLFLSARARERDDNLLFVRDRILRSESDHTALLMLYDRVRRHDRLRDDPSHPLISILRLSGIVRVREGFLFVRNRIYFRVFDREWVRSNLPLDEIARQKAAYRRGVIRVARIAVPVCLALTGLTIYAFHEKLHSRSIANTAVTRILNADIDLYSETSSDSEMTAKLGQFWSEHTAFYQQMGGELGNAEQVDVAQALSNLMAGYASLQGKKDKTTEATALADYKLGVSLVQAAWAQDPKNNRINVLQWILDDELGTYYENEKDDTNAAAAFSETKQAAQNLVRLHDNASSEDDLATAEQAMGVIAEDQKQWTQAMQDFNDELSAGQKAAAADPQDDDDPWTAYYEIALLYEAENDATDASQAFTRCEQEAQKLIRAHDDARSEHHLATVEQQIGIFEDAEKQPQKALQAFEKELSAAQIASNDAQYEEDPWNANNQIGEIYQELGKNVQAADAFRRMQKEAADLVRAHDNAASEDTLATADSHLATIADEQNQPKNALLFDQAALSAALKAADDPQYYEDLWSAYDNLADEEDNIAIGQYAAATQTYQNELSVITTDLGKGPDDTTAAALKHEQAQAYGNLAWSELLSGQYTKALADAQTSLKLNKDEDWMNVNLAHAYLFTNQLTQAESYYFADPNAMISETGKTFGETVLEDFKEFHTRKMSAPGMDAVQQTIVKMMSATAKPKPAATARSANPTAPAPTPAK
jgi:tetratricopeptide (TPR) repeat protein